MRKLLFLLALLPITCVAQLKAESEQDALLLAQRGEDSLSSNPEKSYEYLKAAIKWFEQNTTSGERASTYNTLAFYFVDQYEYDSAAYYYDLATVTYFNLHEYVNALASQDRYIMNCLLPRGKFEEALDLALKVHEMTKDFKDPDVKFMANRLLIDVYWDLDEFSEEFLEIAIEQEELAHEMEDSSRIEVALFFLASAYGRNDKRELSIDVYRRVIKLQLANNDYHVSASYNNIATQYWHLDMMDSAIANYERGLKYSYLEGRADGIAASKLRLGQSYARLGDFKQSLGLCMEAFDILREEKIVRRQEQCTECIQMSYENLGQKEKAYEYLLLDNALRDSILKRGEVHKLKLLQSEFHDELEDVKDSLDFAYQHELNEAEIRERKNQSYFLWAGLGLTALFAFFILNRFRITRQQKKIIESQKVEVELAHEELTEKNQEILDSIVYAKRIQSAILPPDDLFKSNLPNSFVLYKPKDIVAGDFYWMENSGNKILFAAADCTGHGVPGAMVSVICNNGLNRSVREHGLSDPGKILDKTREIVIQEFEKSKEEVKDGMDIALCCLEIGSSAPLGEQIQRTSSEAERPVKLTYAGAHNPLWIIRANGDFEEIKADKQPIGKFIDPIPYSSKTAELNTGDSIYIFTDGYSDQFGGEKGKKMKASNFRKFILSIKDLPMPEQKAKLDEHFESWKGELEQLDDVCIIGVRV